MLSIFIILSLAIFIRYAVFSYLIDILIGKTNLKKVFSFRRKPGQRKKEIILSFYSSVLFGAGFTGLYHLWQKGVIVLAEDKPLWYHIGSLVLALFIHETYYYWLHRLMHQKIIYKYFHKGHHDSVEVSSWTSFSFDPLETFAQILPFYLIFYFVPLHLVNIILFLVIMSVSSVINHLNYEIYPKFFKTTFPFSLLIGATHHALHHKEFNTNFGLYFTFWDKWMATESKNY